MGATRTVKVIIDAVTTGIVGGLKTSVKAAKDFGNELDTLQKKHEASFRKIESTTGRLGLAMGIAVGAAVKVSTDFDVQMSKVVAVSDEGVTALGQFRDAALAAGRATAFTATQAGQAEEELAKAGVSTKDILGGGLSGALNLAAAGDLNLADAAAIAVQAMVEFGLQGKDVNHIADLLSAGANKSAADVQGLGAGLSQLAGLGKSAGLGINETVGVLALFNQSGLKAEEAGTTLKQMLLQLQAPSHEAEQLMKSLGITIYDQSGHFMGLTKIAGNLQSALGGLSEQERNQALATIFGSRAVRGAAILYREGATGVQDWIDSVNDSGAAARVAQTKLDNLGGDIKKLKGSLEALTIESSGGATSGLRVMAKAAEGATNDFNALPNPIKSTLFTLEALTAGSLLGVSGFMKLKTSVGGALESLREMGPVGTKAAGALGVLGKAAGVTALVAVGAEGLYSFGQWFEKATGPIVHDLDAMSTALNTFASSGRVSGELAKTFGADLAGLGRNVKEYEKYQADLAKAPARIRAAVAAGQSAPQLAGADIKRFQHEAAQAKQNLGELDQTLANMVSNGGTSQANLAFIKISDSLKAQGVSTAEINDLFGKYRDATNNAAQANTGLAQGFADASTASGVLVRGLQDAIDHGETLASVWKELNGAALTSLDTDIQVKQDLADLAEKWQRNTNAILDDTQVGRDNLRLMSSVIQDAVKAAEAKYEETNSVEQASQVYNSYIAALKATLLQAGLTQAQVQGLLDTYARMPSVITTQVEVSPLTPGAVSKYSHSQLQTYRWGGITEHAQTGLLRDAGIYSSRNPARYAFAEPGTGGEAFVPRFGDAARSLGILSHAASWYGATVMPTSVSAPTWSSVPTSAASAAPVNITVQLLDTQGHITRKALILDAVNRGIPKKTAEAAYP